MSIQAHRITKQFGAYKALDNVSLEVGEGKLISLLGPSGSGKTTLLRILAGLDFADEDSGAQVLFHGEDVTHLPAGKRGVGFVFQHYALFRHMTVGDNIAFGMRAKPRSERPDTAHIRKRIKELLDLVQLGGLEKRYPSELSGGQRQRVALARALAVDPKVLLLDEPFGALDAKVRKDLRRWLQGFQEQIGITTVFVTHDQEEALELADEVVVMNNARIEQVGDPQTVFDYPASPFVIEFMGNVNRLQSGYQKILSLEERDQLYVRPHDIEIRRRAEGHDLEAKVLHLFSAGSVARVTLERRGTNEILEAEISRSGLHELGLKIGQDVGLRFRHVRLFAKDTSGTNRLVEKDLHPSMEAG
jgi:sulfate/thiosulfate transport system ATP-binding protein